MESRRVRTRDDTKGPRVASDGIKVKGEFCSKAVLCGVDAVVGVPVAVAYIPIGIRADAKDILAVQLLGDPTETFIFEQTGKQWRAWMQHHGPVTRLACKWLIGIDMVELGFVFLAQSPDFLRGEESGQGDKAKGFEML